MTRSAAQAVSARRGAASALGLFLIFGLAQPTLAGDRALIDFIGYSDDFRYFAFEEFGIQDGSGFAYSNVYVIDLPADRWLAQTPIRVQAEDEARGIGAVRAEALGKAQSHIERLNISVPADLIALHGDGAPDREGKALPFGIPGYLPSMLLEEFELRLSTMAAKTSDPCEEWFGIEPQGFVLTLTNEDGERIVHEDGEKLPASRGCAFNYRLYGVVMPFYALNLEHAVAIVSVYPGGFEGPDRRFLAVPLGQ
jgi:predicted secreted protein